MKSNMKMIRDLTACIWDLDGTLIDSYGSIVSSLADVAAGCGAEDTREQILTAVKQGAVSSYLRDLSSRRGADYGDLYQRYREISHSRLDEITLIPGALETLEALRPAQHFIYTHRGRSTASLLDRLGLSPFFQEIVTFDHGFRPKPSGEGIEYLVQKYGLSKQTTAYVGDRTLDVLCAVDAGVKAVLYLPEDSCVIPTGKEDFIIRRLEQLIPDGSPGAASRAGAEKAGG